MQQMAPPSKKRRRCPAEEEEKRRSCWPFDKNRPAPDAKERARLRALDQGGKEWAEERLRSLGASSSSSAVGLGPATPQQYWQHKTGRLPADYDEATQRLFARGHELEPLAAAAYEVMVKSGWLVPIGLVRHPNLPWIHASPDRLIDHDPRGIVEIKCPKYALPLRIKDQYTCQAQQQIACMGDPRLEWCDLFFYLHDDETGKMKGAKCWRIWRSRRYWAYMARCLDIMSDCLMEDREPTRKEIPLRPTMPPVKTQLVLEWQHPEPLESSPVEKL